MPGTADVAPVPVVAIVGSAGGIGALEPVLAVLPHDLPAAVVVVIHLSPTTPTLLPAILARGTDLLVRPAEEGDVLARGLAFVAARNAHVLVGPDGRLHLETSELVHHVRPSADVLLLSLAANHRGACAAVILSGSGTDGAAGAAAVKRAGGLVLAQDEETAEFFGMPGAAILAGGVDRVLPLDGIAPAVIQWARRVQ